MGDAGTPVREMRSAREETQQHPRRHSTRATTAVATGSSPAALSLHAHRLCVPLCCPRRLDGLRKLVRIKLGDDNDMKTARQGLQVGTATIQSLWHHHMRMTHDANRASTP